MKTTASCMSILVNGYATLYCFFKYTITDVIHIRAVYPKIFYHVN